MKTEKKGQQEARRIAWSWMLAILFFAFLYVFLKWNFFICMGLTVLLYLAITLLTKPERKIGEICAGELEHGEELLSRLEEASRDYEAIRHTLSLINDAPLQEEGTKLLSTSGNILRYLEKNPSKIPSARRFIDYYQDTARVILEKHLRLQESGLDTKEVQELKEQTGQALTILDRAFEKQFEKLMQNEMMDMDADIRLLRQTIKADGYEN